MVSSVLLAEGGLLHAIRHVLDARIAEVGGTTVTVMTALSAVLIIVATVWISKIARRGLRRLFGHRGVDAERSAGTLGTLLHYMILVTGFGVALDTVGIDLAALFAAGAIFAIGLGFAMQNIAQNFVSGVILLTERAIKPGDVIDVNNVICRVSRLGIRATIVQTRDGEDIIVPNSLLAGSAVKNYTLETSAFRLRTTVGVTYESDMRRVRQVLESTVAALDWQLREHPAHVIMLEFAANSVVWEVAVWIGDPWRARKMLSTLNEAIWFAFADSGIVIAFPQLDVHFDGALTEGLTRFTGSKVAG